MISWGNRGNLCSFAEVAEMGVAMFQFVTMIAYSKAQLSTCCDLWNQEWIS